VIIVLGALITVAPTRRRESQRVPVARPARGPLVPGGAVASPLTIVDPDASGAAR
jgi:hypothetical protein